MKTRIRRILKFAAAVLIAQTFALLFLTPAGIDFMFPPVARVNAEKFSPDSNTYAVYYDIRVEVSQADLIVVRACSVTRRAESDCLKLIEHLKACYPNVRLRITGCIADAVKKGAAARADPLAPKSQDALPQRTARAYLKVQGVQIFTEAGPLNIRCR